MRRLAGCLTGGTMKGIDKIAKEGAKHVFKKAFAAGAIISGVWTAIRTYRRIKGEIETLEKKVEEAGKEAGDAWDKYIECMKHNHASGSLSPYMNSPTYVRYGDTHYALFQANTAFDSVYWYVRAPGETGYGTNESIDPGDGSRTSSTFSWTAPYGVGTYTIQAYVYFSDTIIELSYDVTVTN